jgi:SAM-dependent methyltransferase
MNYYFKGFFYQAFIDPILSKLHDSIRENTASDDRVIDIACGTGALSMAIAGNVLHVTGIDLSNDIIHTANRSAGKRKIKNVIFEARDASDLSCYKDGEFDVAVTSMAIHQFDADLAINILSEMRRISKKIIITDYNCPMPKGTSRSLAYGIERLAGGDHYRNFRLYMKSGGITSFTKQCGLTIKSEAKRGNGVFTVVVCD